MENKKEEKQRLRKGLWKPEEDLILRNYVETHGEGNWSVVSKKSGLMRGGKSCRLRWKNYLRPNIKRGDISEEEEDLIIRMHKLIGNRWSLIAGRLPGRTDNEVKNYWNTHLNKKLRCLGKRKTDSSDDAMNEIIDMNKKKHLRHQPSDIEPICTIEATRGRKEEIEIESNSSITNALTEEKDSFNSETEVGEMVPPMNEDVTLFDFGEDPFIACMDPFLLFDASEFRAEDDPETYTGMGLESLFMPF